MIARKLRRHAAAPAEERCAPLYFRATPADTLILIIFAEFSLMFARLRFRFLRFRRFRWLPDADYDISAFISGLFSHFLPADASFLLFLASFRRRRRVFAITHDDFRHARYAASPSLDFHSPILSPFTPIAFIFSPVAMIVFRLPPLADMRHAISPFSMSPL